MKKQSLPNNQKPRLIFFGVKYFPSKGGTSRVVENLIRQLKDKYQITIFCFRDSRAQNYIPGVEVIEFRNWIKGAPGVFLYFIISGLYLLFRKKADLIHIHKIDTCLFIPWFYHKARVIATSHESPYVRDKWNGFEKMFFKVSERAYIRSKAELTCISKPLCETYLQIYQKQVTYIPNGITINSKHNDSEADNILKSYETTPGNYMFFAARRIMKTKGLHTMLEGFSQMGYKGKILVAGDLEHASSYVKDLKKKYDHLNVVYLGYIGDLPVLLSLIKKAKFFIFPSETEGMSIMLLEAATTKTPIICSDIKENREVFSDDHVTYFRNMDAADMAKQTLKALENDELLTIKANNAIERIEKNYTWESVANEYHLLYQRVLGHPVN
jgi:glycosyltransferase involved in cell wall biosynthesis